MTAASRGQQINTKYKQISKVVHIFLPEIQPKIISLSASAQISILLRSESEWAQKRCTRLDMQGHGDYLRPINIAMPPNESNNTINSFFTLPHTYSAVQFLDIYFSSLPYKKRNKNSKLLILKCFNKRRRNCFINVQHHFELNCGCAYS